jgi:NAD dependent epimerase/dehydratase family enzyme
MNYKALHKKLTIEQHEPPLKTRDELRFSWGRVTSSCSTSGTRRVILATNLVVCHERGTMRDVLTTS